MKDKPQTWTAPRGQGADEDAQRRLKDAIAGGNEAVSQTRRTSRQREARQAALQMLRDVSSSPALRTGQQLDAADVSTFISDFIEDAKLPASVRPEAKAAATKIVALIVEGDRAGADTFGREAAFDLGDSLAKTNWARPEPEDPRALAERIPRS